MGFAHAREYPTHRQNRDDMNGAPRSVVVMSLKIREIRGGFKASLTTLRFRQDETEVKGCRAKLADAACDARLDSSRSG